MSRPLRISYIVEGKTDFTILDAVVDHLLDGKDYVPNQIQPPTSDYAGDQGPLGGGWKGVLQWCKIQGDESADIGGFANSLVLRNCDYLVIHVDADIAEEDELSSFDLGSADAPTSTCDNIRNHIRALLGGYSVPGQLTICVPAQCTEAWVFVAIYTNELDRYQPIECRREVERLLIGRPEKLVRDKSGSAKKDTRKYQTSAQNLIRNWPVVVNNCIQASIFESDFKAML